MLDAVMAHGTVELDRSERPELPLVPDSSPVACDEPLPAIEVAPDTPVLASDGDDEPVELVGAELPAPEDEETDELQRDALELPERPELPAVLDPGRPVKAVACEPPVLGSPAGPVELKKSESPELDSPVPVELLNHPLVPPAAPVFGEVKDGKAVELDAV